MAILINWIIMALAVFISAYILPGIYVSSFWTALLIALVLGILNAVLKPVLVFLTLPVNILTLGLFVFVINALLIMLAGAIIPGFMVESFWWALIFSLILSLILALADLIFS